MKSKKKVIVICFSLALLFLMVSPLFILATKKNKDLPILGKIPDFTLINSKGIEFNGRELKEKVWVADFIFTTCAGPCPKMTENMAALQKKFKPFLCQIHNRLMRPC